MSIVMLCVVIHPVDDEGYIMFINLLFKNDNGLLWQLHNVIVQLGYRSRWIRLVYSGKVETKIWFCCLYMYTVYQCQ